MKLTNLKIYYSLLSLNNLWFITSSWLFFWLKFMTIGEVGLIDSVAFLIGILFEFPSGIISDRFGRKKTLILSNIFQFTGSLIITLAESKLQIGIGFAIFQLGVALFSGTIESFGYESSVTQKESYEKVLINSNNYSNFSFLFSLLVGGYLYNYNNNLPNLLLTLNYLISFLICLFIQSQKPVESEANSFDLKKLPSKFSFKLISYFLFLLSIAFCFDFGFLKLIILKEFTTPQTNYWFIGLGVVIGTFLSNYFLQKNWSFHKNLKILFFVLIALLLPSFYTTYHLLVVFLMFSFVVIFTNQLFLKYVNERLLDQERASVISFFNFLYKTPYVFLALILGYSFEQHPASLILGYFGLFSLFLYLVVKISFKLGYNMLFERGRSSVAE